MSSAIIKPNGIGAAAPRKEDYRFITGNGHYTDDINRPGQAYAELCTLSPCPCHD